MLPKSRRLSRPDFLLVRKNGRRIETDHFILICSPNLLGHVRLSVEISRKFDKRAVIRNQIRRILMDYFRTSSLVTIPSDIIIIVKNSLKNVASSQVVELLRLETAKLSLITPK